MAEVVKVSSKGQVVIPSSIRDELSLNIGSQLVISRMEDFVLMKKINIPDPKKEFEKLTKRGSEIAKKKGIKNEKDVMRIIHKGRGIKSG